MFSVVVPVYNTEAYLAPCLRSVLDQSEPAEAIVVNDGSPGDTGQAVQPFLDQIRYVEQANAGVTAARNNGARQATGDYLLFLDSDDFYLPGILDAFQKEIEGDPAIDLLYSGFLWADESGEIENTIAPSVFSNSPLEILSVQSIAPVMAIAIRRDLFHRLNGFDETMIACEDWDLWIRAALANAKFHRIDDALSVYRRVPGSVSNQFVKMWQGLTFLHRKHGGALAQAGFPHFAKDSADHFLDRYLPIYYDNDLEQSWLKRRFNRTAKIVPLMLKAPGLARHAFRRAFATFAR